MRPGGRAGRVCAGRGEPGPAGLRAGPEELMAMAAGSERYVFAGGYPTAETVRLPMTTPI